MMIHYFYLNQLPTWIGLEDEVSALLDGGQEGGRAHGRADVVAVVPQVQADRVVHPLQVRGMQVAASGGSGEVGRKKNELLLRH